MNDEPYEVARRKLVAPLHLARIRMLSSCHGSGQEQPGEGHAAAAASVPQVMADLERCKPETRLADIPSLTRTWSSPASSDGSGARHRTGTASVPQHHVRPVGSQVRAENGPRSFQRRPRPSRVPVPGQTGAAPRPSLHRPAHRQRAGGRTGTVAGDRPQTLRR